MAIILLCGISLVSLTGCASKNKTIDDFTVSVDGAFVVNREGTDYMCLNEAQRRELFECNVELVRNS